MLGFAPETQYPHDVWQVDQYPSGSYMNNAELFAEKLINFFPFCSDLSEADKTNMREELIKKYSDAENYLDSKFLSEVLKAGDVTSASSQLWELVIFSKLLSHSMVEIDPHLDCGPDWSIKVNNNKFYYIEATCAQIPENKYNSEIHRVMQEFATHGTSSSDNKIIAEAMSRISNRIYEKINKHKCFMNSKIAGYILVISYGGLPFYTSCDLYKAIQTIYPFGEQSIKFTVNHLNKPQIVEQSLKQQTSYIKPSTMSPIPTNIFCCDEYNWVSAILLSKVEPYLLLDAATKLPLVSWRGTTNDFVLAHNPQAVYPLLEDVFKCRTIVKVKNLRLVIEGENIFPSFG